MYVGERERREREEHREGRGEMLREGERKKKVKKMDETLTGGSHLIIVE